MNHYKEAMKAKPYASVGEVYTEVSLRRKSDLGENANAVTVPPLEGM